MADTDPLRELLKVQKRMNQLCESAMARTDFEAQAGFDTWMPIADVYETPEAWVLCVELPGLEQDGIDVRLDGDELIVEGERDMERSAEGEQFHRVESSYGKFSRRFPLPSIVERGRVQASYRDGLLLVKLPRKDGHRPRSMRVAIR